MTEAEIAAHVLATVQEQYRRWLDDNDGTLDDAGLLPGSAADHAESFYEILAAASLNTQCDDCQAGGYAHVPECYFANDDDDDDEGCAADGHIGPVVPTGAFEVIDHGVALTFRCNYCGATAEAAVDLEEVTFLP